MKSGCPLTLSCLAALLCLNLPLQAQVGDYPPPRGETSWEKPIEDYWKELTGHDVKDCVAGPTQPQPPQSPLDLKSWTEDKSLAPIRVSYDDGWDYHLEMEPAIPDRHIDAKGAIFIDPRLVCATSRQSAGDTSCTSCRCHSGTDRFYQASVVQSCPGE
jgi:hypothetical protein